MSARKLKGPYQAEDIKVRLMTDQRWIEKAILTLFDRQTRDEQRAERAIVHNGVGFTGPDSRMMTYYANWLRSGKHLSGRHLEAARTRIQKYAGQLARIANEKAGDPARRTS